MRPSLQIQQFHRPSGRAYDLQGGLGSCWSTGEVGGGSWWGRLWRISGCLSKFKSWGGKNIKCWGFEWISGLIAIALKVLKSQERGLSRRWTSEHLLHVLILVILILSVITRIIHPEFYQHLVMLCPNSHSIFCENSILHFLSGVITGSISKTPSFSFISPPNPPWYVRLEPQYLCAPSPVRR